MGQVWENKIIKLATMTLWWALIFVYVVLFYVKWDVIKSSQNEIEETIINETGKIDILDTKDTNKKNIETINIPTITKEKTILSWTREIDWNTELIDKLKIEYDYALQDSKEIIYRYLWEQYYSYDFGDIVRKLWWDIYPITTEEDMIKNKLFGDRVTYINLPEYKNKKVILLVYKWDDKRLLQIDYSIYHNTKSYLRDLFND